MALAKHVSQHENHWALMWLLGLQFTVQPGCVFLNSGPDRAAHFHFAVLPPPRPPPLMNSARGEENGFPKTLRDGFWYLSLNWEIL